MAMPCGRCDIGTYDAVPFLKGVDHFSGVASQEEALAIAPKCKKGNHICIGAKHWITGTDFPIDVDQLRQMVFS